jgi:hypothetical protein
VAPSAAALLQEENGGCERRGGLAAFVAAPQRRALSGRAEANALIIKAIVIMLALLADVLCDPLSRFLPARQSSHQWAFPPDLCRIGRSVPWVLAVNNVAPD